MDERISNLLYERVLIQFLFSNEKVRDRLVPYLNPLVFQEHSNSLIIESIIKFIEMHEHFPKVSELKLFIKEIDVYNTLIEILNLDTSDYEEDFILSELEEFYRKGLLREIQYSLSENMKKSTGEIQNLPDEFRNALSFTFDDKIGMDLLNDSDLIYEQMHRKDNVTQTMIKELDKLIEGGFHEKTLNILLGGVNCGKSLWLCALTVNFLLQNKKILYLTLEMSEYKILERILANLFDVEIGLLKHLTKKQFDEYYKLIRQKIKSNLHVVQYGAKTVSANKLRKILKDFEVKKGVKFDGVVIDYLGLCTVNNKTKDQNSYSEQKLISEEFRSVFVEMEHPCFCLTAGQVNRESMNKIDFDMTGMSESLGPGMTADVIMGISTSEELKAAGKYKLNILKNRYGLNDIGMFIGVDYPKMRVYSLEENNNDEIAKPIKVVDQAAVEVLSGLKTNIKTKRNNIMGIE